jgi:NADH-quinone oxidoreductase subunit J
VALATFVTIISTTTTAFRGAEIGEEVTSTDLLGDALFTRFVIPFEAVSFLLLAVLIGGIVIARRDPK